MKGVLIRLGGAIGGVLVIVCGVLYLAWAASLSHPVNWDGVATIAAFFAPIGLIGALIADIWLRDQ